MIYINKVISNILIYNINLYPFLISGKGPIRSIPTSSPISETTIGVKVFGIVFILS